MNRYPVARYVVAAPTGRTHQAHPRFVGDRRGRVLYRRRTVKTFQMLGPVAVYTGPGDKRPEGWWVILSSGWAHRYERIWRRLYWRATSERYPVILRGRNNRRSV